MEDYFSLISGKFGKEEADRKVDAKISSFSGLLTREAAAKLIAAEEGLIKEEALQISGIKDGARDVSVKGKIKKILPMNEYRTGKRSRSFVLKDETGEIEIKLWNEDADSIRGFHLGDRISIRNGYIRDGILNIGYKGKVEMEGREEFLSPSTLKEGTVSCRGEVSSIAGMGGEEFTFSITDGQKEAQACITHIPTRGERIAVGDTVLLEGAEWDGKELRMGEHSRLLVKKNSPDIFRGPLEAAEVGPESASMTVGGQEFSVNTADLVKFLKLEGLKKDIDLPSVAGIKLDGMKGMGATILFEEREGKRLVKELSLR
ncbi:MAG: OB-fold nucleic acid binding domain-containing protein [Candidatus ainarchaeum sp.]|nr:OB-fold nucleic acid binding domain-containing protein [Candidatus ainarchaeum sp.]MDD5096251.1 OB-fold nucleic acid binding domain-containing protein [Candidatus ainarchaeum sp.]